VELLDAAAVCDGPLAVPHARVAAEGGRSYLSLGDRARTVVEVGPDACRVCERPPVRFLFPGEQHDLPTPQRGGRAERLLDFLNLDADQPRWCWRG
jgi:hypothetical protein